jgi:hypothetical protein
VDVDEAADISSQSMLETFGRESRRELFLDEMKLVVPWAESGALIEPHHAKAFAIMLRIFCLQHEFGWRKGQPTAVGLDSGTL